MTDLPAILRDFLTWLFESPLPWLGVVALGFWGAFKSDEWRRQEIKEMRERQPYNADAWKRAARRPRPRPPWWRRFR